MCQCPDLPSVTHRPCCVKVCSPLHHSPDDLECLLIRDHLIGIPSNVQVEPIVITSDTFESLYLYTHLIVDRTVLRFPLQTSKTTTLLNSSRRVVQQIAETMPRLLSYEHASLKVSRHQNSF